MKKDDSLLILDKKLESNTEKEIVLNKFTMLKPNMKVDFSKRLNKDGLMNFLEQMKQSNIEMAKNKSKYNIEDDSDNDEPAGENEAEEPKIELDLALGVLEKKDKKELTPDNAIKSTEDEDEIEGTKNLVNFIVNEKDKKK